MPRTLGIMSPNASVDGAHAPLKPTQHLILLLLAEESTYGVELLIRLEQRSRGAIRLNAGSLYRLIGSSLTTA